MGDDDDRQMWLLEVYNVRRLGAFASVIGVFILAVFAFLL